MHCIAVFESGFFDVRFGARQGSSPPKARVQAMSACAVLRSQGMSDDRKAAVRRRLLKQCGGLPPGGVPRGTALLRTGWLQSTQSGNRR